MAVSPGTGAGIGIALALLVLLVAGPGAYYYRQRRRRQLEVYGQYGSRDAEISQAGDDYYGGVKPQLDDTGVSPEVAWRATSRSTINNGPNMVAEVAASGQVPAQMIGPGGDRTHPTVLGPGPQGLRIQELDVLNQGRRPELSSGVASPPPIELRADKSPPVDATAEKDKQALAALPIEPEKQFATSGDSLQLPALPGPVLPPKTV